MIIDGKGLTLEGANIVLTKNSHLYNIRLVRCDIDDVDAIYPFSTNCQLIDCKLRSQFELTLFKQGEV
jgi:hypothetical protein